MAEKEIVIDYVPNKKQVRFHESAADELLYGGAAGGGKTKALVMDAFALGMAFPGCEPYLFRRTFRESGDTLIKEAIYSIPPECGKYNSTEHEFRLINGSVLKFRQIENEAALQSYRGSEIAGLYIDELTTFPENYYVFLKSRVRTKKTMGLKPIIRCASNPGGIGHAWVKKRFVSPHPKGGQHKDKAKDGRVKIVQYIPATVWDNPHVNDEYIDNLKMLPEALRKALLDGSWDAFEGQCFVEFVDDPSHYSDMKHTHVITPFIIPKHWRRYRSMDWGYAKPFSIGWWAVEPGTDRLFRYAEWYGTSGRFNEGSKMSPSQVANGIKERESKNPNSAGCDFRSIADPHIWDEDGGKSTGDHFVENGITWEMGDNNRMNGKLQMHIRLRFDDEGFPGMYVFNSCKEFIRTIPALVYGRRDEEDIDTDGDDHCITGDTLIVTSSGVTPIKDMVGTHGKVLSSDGKFHTYEDVRQTQAAADIFEVTLDDGTTVKATANHRFMLADGSWKRLDELTEGDDLIKVLA